MSALQADPPRRIASLLASGTEILFALGLGKHVVAVSHECDFPAAARALPRVTSSLIAPDAPSRTIDQEVRDRIASGAALYEIDNTALASLAPDLIVTQAQCDVCAVRYEDVLGLVRNDPRLRDTQVVALNPHTLDDIFADIQRVGQAAGRAAEAARYVAALEARVAAVRDKTVALAPADRPRVACLEWIEPLMLAANWMPQLVELAGGRQPLDQSGRHSTYGDWQQLVDFDPQIVVVMPCGFDLERAVGEARRLAELPGWRDLAAVGAGRVFAVDGNALFNRSGPRIVDSLEILAGLVQPERFGWPARERDGIEVWRALS